MLPRLAFVLPRPAIAAPRPGLALPSRLALAAALVAGLASFAAPAPAYAASDGPSASPSSPSSSPSASAAPSGTSQAPTSPPSDRGGEQTWTVSLETPAARAGQTSHAVARITALAGYHVNLEYPLSFRPSPEATVEFQGARIALTPASRAPCPGGGKDTCSITAEIPFTAPRAGEARLAGTLAFSVCTADRCLIEKVTLSSAVSAR